MRSPLIILLAIPLLAAAMLFGALSPHGASAQVCGPGAHWIHVPVPCPAGDDNLNTGALVGIDTDGDCVRDQNLVLSGPATIHRNTATDASSPPFPPAGASDGHIDVIDTEIVSMVLTGGGFTLRAGAGGSPSLSASYGAIAEQAGDPALADSFFDVFFEILTPLAPPLDKLYNHSDLRVSAVIRQVPPEQTIYVHPQNFCLDLFTQPVGGNDTGLNLVEAAHAVGGISELPDDAGAALPLSTGASDGSSTTLFAALAGAAAAAVALATGGWYARRHWQRRRVRL